LYYVLADVAILYFFFNLITFKCNNDLDLLMVAPY
jgi:hypothetical protein